MAQYIDKIVTGTIKPLANNTRLRVLPTTLSNVLNSYPAGAVVGIDLVREYTETIAGEYVTNGDKWGRVISVNGQAPKDLDGKLVTNTWMAIKYQRASNPQICTEDYVVSGGGNPTPVPATPKWIGATLIPQLENGQDGEPIKMIVEP